MKKIILLISLLFTSWVLNGEPIPSEDKRTYSSTFPLGLVVVSGSETLPLADCQEIAGCTEYNLTDNKFYRYDGTGDREEVIVSGGGGGGVSAFSALSGNISLAQFPLACDENQVIKKTVSAWVCADENVFDDTPLMTLIDNLDQRVQTLEAGGGNSGEITLSRTLPLQDNVQVGDFVSPVTDSEDNLFYASTTRRQAEVIAKINLDPPVFPVADAITVENLTHYVSREYSDAYDLIHFSADLNKDHNYDKGSDGLFISNNRTLVDSQGINLLTFSHPCESATCQFSSTITRGGFVYSSTKPTTPSATLPGNSINFSDRLDTRITSNYLGTNLRENYWVEVYLPENITNFKENLYFFSDCSNGNSTFEVLNNSTFQCINSKLSDVETTSNLEGYKRYLFQSTSSRYAYYIHLVSGTERKADFKVPSTIVATVNKGTNQIVDYIIRSNIQKTSGTTDSYFKIYGTNLKAEKALDFFMTNVKATYSNSFKVTPSDTAPDILPNFFEEQIFYYKIDESSGDIFPIFSSRIGTTTENSNDYISFYNKVNRNNTALNIFEISFRRFQYQDTIMFADSRLFYKEASYPLGFKSAFSGYQLYQNIAVAPGNSPDVTSYFNWHRNKTLETSVQKNYLYPSQITVGENYRYDFYNPDLNEDLVTTGNPFFTRSNIGNLPLVLGKHLSGDSFITGYNSSVSRGYEVLSYNNTSRVDRLLFPFDTDGRNINRLTAHLSRARDFENIGDVVFWLHIDKGVHDYLVLIYQKPTEIYYEAWGLSLVSGSIVNLHTATLDSEIDIETKVSVKKDFTSTQRFILEYTKPTDSGEREIVRLTDDAILGVVGLSNRAIGRVKSVSTVNDQRMGLVEPLGLLITQPNLDLEKTYYLSSIGEIVDNTNPLATEFLGIPFSKDEILLKDQAGDLLIINQSDGVSNFSSLDGKALLSQLPLCEDGQSYVTTSGAVQCATPAGGGGETYDDTAVRGLIAGNTAKITDLEAEAGGGDTGFTASGTAFPETPQANQDFYLSEEISGVEAETTTTMTVGQLFEDPDTVGFASSRGGSTQGENLQGGTLSPDNENIYAIGFTPSNFMYIWVLGSSDVLPASITVNGEKISFTSADPETQTGGWGSGISKRVYISATAFSSLNRAIGSTATIQIENSDGTFVSFGGTSIAPREKGYYTYTNNEWVFRGDFPSGDSEAYDDTSLRQRLDKQEELTHVLNNDEIEYAEVLPDNIKLFTFNPEAPPAFDDEDLTVADTLTPTAGTYGIGIQLSNFLDPEDYVIEFLETDENTVIRRVNGNALSLLSGKGDVAKEEASETFTILPGTATSQRAVGVEIGSGSSVVRRGYANSRGLENESGYSNGSSLDLDNPDIIAIVQRHSNDLSVRDFVEVWVRSDSETGTAGLNRLKLGNTNFSLSFDRLETGGWANGVSKTVYKSEPYITSLGNPFSAVARQIGQISLSAQLRKRDGTFVQFTAGKSLYSAGGVNSYTNFDFRGNVQLRLKRINHLTNFSGGFVSRAVTQITSIATETAQALIDAIPTTPSGGSGFGFLTSALRDMAQNVLVWLVTEDYTVVSQVHNQVRYAGSDTYSDSYTAPDASDIPISIEGAFYNSDREDLRLRIVRSGVTADVAFPSISGLSNGVFTATISSVQAGDVYSTVESITRQRPIFLGDIERLKNDLANLIANEPVTTLFRGFINSFSEVILDRVGSWKLADNAKVDLFPSFAVLKTVTPLTQPENEITISSTTVDHVNSRDVNSNGIRGSPLYLNFIDKNNSGLVARLNTLLESGSYPRESRSVVSIKESGSNSFRSLIEMDSNGLKIRTLLRAGATTTRTDTLPLFTIGNTIFEDVTQDDTISFRAHGARTYAIRFATTFNERTRTPDIINYVVSDASVNQAKTSQTLTFAGENTTDLVSVEYQASTQTIIVEISGLSSFQAPGRSIEVMRVSGTYDEQVTTTTNNVYAFIRPFSSAEFSPNASIAFSISEVSNRLLLTYDILNGSLRSSGTTQLNYSSSQLDFSKVRFGDVDLTLSNIQGSSVSSGQTISTSDIQSFRASTGFVGGYVLPPDTIGNNKILKSTARVYFENLVNSKGERISKPGDVLGKIKINFVPLIYTGINWAASPTPHTLTEESTVDAQSPDGVAYFKTHRHPTLSYSLNSGADGVATSTMFNVDLRTKSNGDDFYTNLELNDSCLSGGNFETSYFGNVTVSSTKNESTRFVLPIITTYHYNNPSSNVPTNVISRTLIEPVKLTDSPDPVWILTFSLSNADSLTILNQDIPARTSRIRVDFSVIQATNKDDLINLKNDLNENSNGVIDYSQYATIELNKAVNSILSSAQFYVECRRR